MLDLRTDHAALFIYVFKEGALSRVGHDLKLQLAQFDFQVSKEHAATATFDLRSITVVGAMHGGRASPSVLSPRDRRDIVKNMARSVLHTDRYPDAVFRSTRITSAGTRYRVAGNLKLHGVEQPLEFTATRAPSEVTARIPFRLSDFGMKPYRALLGALKTQDEVVIEVRVPLAS